MDGGNDPNNNHIHYSQCGCSEEIKNQDPSGVDLFEFIDHNRIEAFNEK